MKKSKQNFFKLNFFFGKLQIFVYQKIENNFFQILFFKKEKKNFFSQRFAKFFYFFQKFEAPFCCSVRSVTVISRASMRYL